MNAHTTQPPSHELTIAHKNHVATESAPCTSDLRSYEIDYDEISECTESNLDKKGMTAKRNEISPAKMPLMRIRSVEIVFEDEMSTCTDTGILDRSLELLVSDSSDDSTKCVEDLEPLADKEPYDSVTLNADDDLSDDNSVSLKNNDDCSTAEPELQVESIHVQTENLTLPPLYKATLSPNVSDVGDSGRYTEDATSSHFETVATYDDALLSHSCDVIDVDIASTSMSVFEISEVCAKPKLLYEYIDSESDSDETATCDVDVPSITNLSINPEDTLDGFDQYDSFIDMGKF